MALLDPTRAPAGAKPSLVRPATLIYGAVLVFALGFSLLTGTWRSLAGEEPLPEAGALLAGPAVGLLLVAVSHLLYRLSEPVRRTALALAQFLGRVRLAEALYLALLSGVCEEVLFRGALWPFLGLAGTTVLFGLMHLVPRKGLLLYAAFALGAGLLLGLLRQGTESLIPPVLAHVTVNALNLPFLLRLRQAPDHAAGALGA